MYECEREKWRVGGCFYLPLMPSRRLYGEYFCSFLGLTEIGILLHLFNCSCSSSQAKSILNRCLRYSFCFSCCSQSSVSTLLSSGLESNRFLLMLFFDSMAGRKGAGGGFVSISGAIIKFDIMLYFSLCTLCTLFLVLISVFSFFAFYFCCFVCYAFTFDFSLCNFFTLSNTNTHTLTRGLGCFKLSSGKVT